MTVKELKEAIVNLPDDMEVIIELDITDNTDVADYLNGYTTTDIKVERYSKLWINAIFNFE